MVSTARLTMKGRRLGGTLLSMLLVLVNFSFMSSPGEKELLLHFSSVGKIKEKHFHLPSGLDRRDVCGQSLGNGPKNDGSWRCLCGIQTGKDQVWTGSKPDS